MPILSLPSPLAVKDYFWAGTASSVDAAGDEWTISTRESDILLSHAGREFAGASTPITIDIVTGDFPNESVVVSEESAAHNYSLTTAISLDPTDPTKPNYIRAMTAADLSTPELVYDPATNTFTGTTDTFDNILLYPDPADPSKLLFKSSTTAAESTTSLSISGGRWQGSVYSDPITLQSSVDGLTMHAPGYVTYGNLAITPGGDIDGSTQAYLARETILSTSTTETISIRAAGEGTTGTLSYSKASETWSGSSKDTAGNFMMNATADGTGFTLQASSSHSVSSPITLTVAPVPPVMLLEDHSDYLLLKAGGTFDLTAGTHFPINRAFNLTVYAGGGGGGGGHGGSTWISGQSGGPGGAGAGGQRRAWNFKANELEEGARIVARVGLGGIGGWGGKGNDSDGGPGGWGEPTVCSIYDHNGVFIRDLDSDGGVNGFAGHGRSGPFEDHEDDGSNGESTSPPFQSSTEYTGEGGKGGYTYHKAKNGGPGGPGELPGAGGGAGGGGGWEDDFLDFSDGGRGGNGGRGADGLIFISWGAHRNYAAPDPEQFPPNYRDNNFDEGTRFKNYQISKMLALSVFRKEYYEMFTDAVKDCNVAHSGSDPYIMINDENNVPVKCFRNMPEFGDAVEQHRPGLIKWLKEGMQLEDEDIQDLAEANSADGIDLIEAYFLNNFLFGEAAVRTSKEFIQKFFTDNNIVKIKVTHKAWAYKNSKGSPGSPYAWSLFKAVNAANNTPDKSNYNRPTSYKPYEEAGVTTGQSHWIRSMDAHSEDIPLLEFITSSGSTVPAGDIPSYIRGGAYAMMIIAQDGPESWLDVYSGPVQVGLVTGKPVVPIITEEVFSINFSKWKDNVQLYNFDLASSADSSPTSGEVARSFYMTDDFHYHHVYATLFWMLRDQAIRGKDGPFLFEGGEYIVGSTPKSGFFYLEVEELKSGDILLNLQAISELWSIKIHEEEKSWIKEIIMGIVLIVVTIIFAIFCQACLVPYLEAVSSWLVGAAAAIGIGAAAAAVIGEVAYVAYQAYNVYKLVDAVKTIEEGHAESIEAEAEAKEEDSTKVEVAEAKQLAKELEAKREARFDFMMEEDEEHKEEMDPFYKMSKEQAVELDPFTTAEMQRKAQFEETNPFN